MRKRLIPKICFINYHKRAPLSKGIWTEWFHLSKDWRCSIIYISIKHFSVVFDFRQSCGEDMRHYPQDAPDAAEKNTVLFMGVEMPIEENLRQSSEIGKKRFCFAKPVRKQHLKE